jgi:hypothetical protein
MLDMRFRNIDAEIGVKTVGFKNKEQWQKVGICMIKCKEKCERMVRKPEREVEISRGSNRICVIKILKYNK